MQHLPLAISIAALLVGIFTFWWSNIREPRAFYLVRLQRPTGFDGTTFALVNGSKKDILVTSLAIYFETQPRGSRFYPAARIQGGEAGKADLIASGKAVEFHVTFSDPLTSTLAKQGPKGNPWPSLHTHFIGVEVAWVDTRGESYTARVLHSQVGLAPDGRVMGGGPVGKKSNSYNLYTAAA